MMSRASSQSARTNPGNYSTDGLPVDEPAAAKLRDDVAKVAEGSSISSASSHGEPQALNPRPDSNLDPASSAFDARTWVKDFIRMTESDPESAPQRSLGVAFKGLSVFGWGAAAEFQKTTGSILAEIANYLANLIRGKRHGRRVDILRDFEGVVEKGEMLLVLGPPGSGCSTLLKSLSGETAGLNVTPESCINFRGMFMSFPTDQAASANSVQGLI